MAYELRNGGKAVGTFESSEKALEQARVLLRSDPDADPDILDTATGRAFEPAASKRWREHLANNVGF